MNKNIPIFIEKGSELAGAATGGALGFLSCGPVGAAIGSGTGVIISMAGEVVADYIQRTLSNREIIRSAGAAALSINQIKMKLDNGQELRDDDFFRIRIAYRPKAEELFEAMLLKSKNQYEEHKVNFYANLFSNACFDDSLEPDMISWFMLVLERLTFGHLNTLNELVLLGSNSKWEWGDMSAIEKMNPIIASHLEELKSMRLLTQDHWGDTPIASTNIAITFIKAIGFSNPFACESDHILRANKCT
ncbi:hypothetical protein [Aliivibrio fischeri]|uniref:Uncharacterized protein n=1 Tax=Aliivibrio fischeri SR5 TaxID=1088719 RepID=A0AAV3EMN5_ALIFS|nr:hypothetical protein [Aliivibrio fischeri]EHN68015.1 hypothetical protein VFSR5_2740 [Aliivibrio fischeri SR5]OCH01844.1 hypothetical protein A6E10_18390 [Aliivibrio fischeri]